MVFHFSAIIFAVKKVKLCVIVSMLQYVHYNRKVNSFWFALTCFWKLHKKILLKPVAMQLGIPLENVFANQLLFGNSGEFAGFDAGEPTSRSGGKATAVQQIRKVKVVSSFHQTCLHRVCLNPCFVYAGAWLQVIGYDWRWCHRSWGISVNHITFCSLAFNSFD